MERLAWSQRAGRAGAARQQATRATRRRQAAKTSLYRHFRTKDDLVAAFLKREDEDFWRAWDAVAGKHGDDPAGELYAHVDWIAERVGRPHYRGCPQLNVAAEFPQAEHPARLVATAHKLELRRRLFDIEWTPLVSRPLINGAFVSAPILSQAEAKGGDPGADRGVRTALGGGLNARSIHRRRGLATRGRHGAGARQKARDIP